MTGGLTLVGAVIALLSGCGGRGGAMAPRQQPGEASLPRATRGYILISIDTLRADHLGCYGYIRPTTPFLDELSRRSTVFEEAYSQFPSTLVSHMSIFTGLYPREHGVLPPNDVLSPAIETLPEAFQRQGFRTGGFTEGGFVSGRFGFRRGFDVFVSRDRHRDRPIEGTFRRAADFLAGLRPGERFFLFIHTYAVHTPYDAPARYREPFWPGPPPPGAITPTGPDLVRANMLAERPPQAVIDWLTASYDAGIRQTDEVLRNFFGALERLGLAREATVMVTADHGEEFMEHGLFNHTQLYRETLHVPLLVTHPGQRSAVRHSGVVQLVDLAPTLYELARVRHRGRLAGTSLARLVGRPAPPHPGTAWAEAFDGMRAIYRGERRQLESLLLFAPDPEAWFARRFAFDAPGGALAFQARSFIERRRLTIRQGPRVLAQVELTPEWTPVQVAPAVASRLMLDAGDCAIPPAEEDAREPRRYAFQVKGLRLKRVEYYDVSRDPGQQRDLARGSASAARRLLRDLLNFHPRALAAGPAPPPLEPALRRALRALGYVQ
jgi:arylsulfatase A-like enzyme